jgi:hypothetical protein
MKFSNGVLSYPGIHSTQFRAWLICTGLIILNLAIHFPFLLTNSFGEQDAARLANNSLLASTQSSGLFYTNKEPVYSAPLYSEVLRIGAKLGLINPSNIIRLMTIASFLASAVVTGTLFIFTSKITGSAWIALGACIVLQLNPTFWNNSIYGFPSIVAIALMLISLVIFETALKQGKVHYQVALILVAFLVFLLAITTKIDTLLTGAILFLPIWISNLARKQKIIYSGIVFCVILICLLLYTQFTKALLINQEATAFFDQWNSKFPIDIGYFFSKENIRIIATAAGILCIPIAIIATIVLIWDRKYLPIIFWLTLSAIPIVFFWGLRVGNSARHNLLPIIALVILLTLPLGTKYKNIWALILVVMCLSNYVIITPSSSTIKPSGQLVASSKLIKQQILYLEDEGRSIAGLPEEKIAIIGNGPAQPYYLFELFRKHGLDDIDIGFELKPAFPRIKFQDDLTQAYVWIYGIPPTDEIIQLVNSGYNLVVFDSQIRDMLKNIESMKDRYKHINEINR